MLRSLHEVQGYTVCGIGGDFGKVKEFLFDPRTWQVRYLGVDTGEWLADREVLIAPDALDQPIWLTQRLPIHLTRDELEHAPKLEAGRPVDPEHHRALNAYFGWPVYGLGGAGWGAASPGPLTPPLVAFAPPPAEPREEPATDSDRPRLRSSREIDHLQVVATDGTIGRTEDLIVDDQTWHIRYVVVNTSPWITGRKVLLSPRWVQAVDPSAGHVVVNLTRAKIEKSPLYQPGEPINRDYEGNLSDYYGRPKYWEEEPAELALTYLCPACGHHFLSKLELKAHRSDCGTPQPAPSTLNPKKETSVVERLEGLRPASSGGWRQDNRSS